MCVVVVLKMTCDVVLVVFRTVASLRAHPYTYIPDGPESSNNDQFHAHDNCKFLLPTVEPRGRSHHQQHNQHNHSHPRPSPHKRVDERKNFAAVCSHSAVALTMNFYFDSHWQQSRSIRWNCTVARKFAVNTRRHLQMCVVRDVAVKIEIQLVKALP
jgi:hypothetical protein